jgi:hypothetical protein
MFNASNIEICPNLFTNSPFLATTSIEGVIGTEDRYS